MFNRLNITLNQFIASDLFLGYHVTNWNPRINFFLLGSYRNTNIFNINYTYSFTRKFIQFTSDLYFKKAHLWVVNENFSYLSKNSQFSFISKSFPEMNLLTDKWCKGTLSNYKHVLSVKPAKFPHAIFAPNIQNNHFVVNESFIINIPSWGISDSQDNPTNVFFPIPGNAKSLRSLFFFFVLLCKTLMYSRYFTSSGFLFKSLSFSKRFLKRCTGNYRFLAKQLLSEFFFITGKSFLTSDLVFLLKYPFSLRRRFSFFYSKHLKYNRGLAFLKWKFPLILIVNIFKNILFKGFLNTVKKKVILSETVVFFFKNLIFILSVL